MSPSREPIRLICPSATKVSCPRSDSLTQNMPPLMSSPPAFKAAPPGFDKTALES